MSGFEDCQYLGNVLRKRRLYPTVVCYHGCVDGRSQALTFRQVVADIKMHVGELRRAGYEFVLPSVYAAWQRGEVQFDRPIACIHFDDGLASVDKIVPWLISQNVPCGLALITRRLGNLTPERDFITWSRLRQYVSSGLVQILCHTHNMHHLTVVRRSDGEIDVAPVLEGPAWLDDGDVLYLDAGDSRPYWDFSIIDRTALGVPIWGTDQYDGSTPITTTFRVVPKVTGSVSVMRLWMSLSRPYSTGYAAQVEIRASGALVWSGTIEPKNYETRSQWVEREFYSITLDTPFSVTAGAAIELEFRTLNSGGVLATLYGIPTNNAAWWARTTCRGLWPEGSQGRPNRTWQYIDYPQNDRWPVRPAIILGFGTGSDTPLAQYQLLVQADLDAFADAVNKNLNATWFGDAVWRPDTYYWLGPRSEVVANIDPDDPPAWYTPFKSCPPVGSVAGSIVSATVIATPNVSGTVAEIGLQFTNPEDFCWVEGGEIRGDGWPFPANTEEEKQSVEAAQLRSYTAVFDVFVDGVRVASVDLYKILRDGSFPCDEFTVETSVPRTIRISPINRGPTIGDDVVVRWGIKRLTFFVRNVGAATPVTQIVYPFGSYYSDGIGPIQQRPFLDVGQALKTVLLGAGYERGWTIQAYRNVRDDEPREPDLRRKPLAQSRWLVYGDQAPDVSLNNLAAVSGYLFRDAQHHGVEWQASIEPDPAGNTSAAVRSQTIDYAAFDAWFFDASGNIVPARINDGGTYDGVEYANDKAMLQSRGVRCLLIISNYNPALNDPDPAIGSYVVNNAAVYIPQIVQVCVTNGWDGITINLEAIPAADRAAASAFFVALSRAMHAAGKLLHATVPAITGTAYDASWWTGWCDLSVMARHCDAIKVMSYTETGSGTLPGPSTPAPSNDLPDGFFDAVYQYARTVVPAAFWGRVLIGCRSFGHLWPDVDVSLDANYVTYHQAIAEALKLGARIDQLETELGWGRGGTRCWAGTPETVERAAARAEATFGGVGLWLLDAGDIEEFLPDTRQLGRIYEDENMSVMPDVLFPESLSFGSSGGPRFATTVVAVQSGSESRNALWTYPLHAYDVSLAVRTTQQMEIVRNIFMVARGRWRAFRFKDWADFSATNQVIDAALDGVRTNFQLIKTYTVGSESLVRKISFPRAGTVRMFRSGVEYLSGFSVNAATGLVSFTAPPAAGGVLTATFEFDVPVRFDTDELPTEYLTRGADGQLLLSAGTIPLVEVRL